VCIADRHSVNSFAQGFTLHPIGAAGPKPPTLKAMSGPLWEMTRRFKRAPFRSIRTIQHRPLKRMDGGPCRP